MTDWIKRQLHGLKEKHAYRNRTPIQSAQGSRVVIDGHSYLSFSSNDYLGLANDTRIIEAFIKGAQQYGVGAGASPLVTGYSTAHQQLEEALAEFLGCQRVILFSSGYAANVGLQTALYNRHWNIFADRLNHASLIDATRFSGASMLRYHNLDVEHLESLLKKQAGNNNNALVTDAVFSMDGTTAPLDQLVSLKNRYQCQLLIDDAHGFGVLGKDGSGTLNTYSLQASDVTAITATFGKALGTSGAFIATSNDVAEYLVQKSRALIYSTAAPPAIAAATLKSLRIIYTEPERRQQLTENIEHFRNWAEQADLTLTQSKTPIQSIVIGNNTKTIAISQQLKQKGILIVPIRPPTVPEGTARLRVTLCANHSSKDIDFLIATLSETMRRSN